MLNRRPRRQVNQMNVVPYIDVMLVLLVIFMVTAPMFTPGVIDVPSVSHARQVDTRPIEVMLDSVGHITLQLDNAIVVVNSLDELLARVKAVSANERPFVVSAHKDLKYSEVLKVVDELHKAGVRRVALTVKQLG